MVFKSTAQKMKFSIKDFFIKSDQIRSYGKLYFFFRDHSYHHEVEAETRMVILPKTKSRCL